jgi:spore germination cell wall hydrolase CwlJ-like protein
MCLKLLGFMTILIQLCLSPSWAESVNKAKGLNCNNPQSEYACMACNCFNEAGNQSYEGQLAVGKVVQSRRFINSLDNRKGLNNPRFKSSVCGVVKEYKQFSWWRLQRQFVPAGHSCFQAAKESLKYRGYYADHYHADYVRPRWRKDKNMVKLAKIGDHIFYASAKDLQSQPPYVLVSKNDTPRGWNNTWALLGFD